MARQRGEDLVASGKVGENQGWIVRTPELTGGWRHTGEARRKLRLAAEARPLLRRMRPLP